MTTWTSSAKVGRGGALSTFAPREERVPQELIDAIANHVEIFAVGKSWTRRSSFSPRRDTAVRGWLRSVTAWE
jgi:hypothetical protein